MVIIGCDISLEHGGFCFLDSEGKPFRHRWFTNIIRDSKAPSAIRLFAKKKEYEDRETFCIRRVAEYLTLFRSHVFEMDFQQACYYSIEGYAYGAITNSICQTAELIGPVKNQIYAGGGILRIHDPVSTKFFATGKGNATKKEMVEQAEKEGFSPDIPFGIEKRKVRKEIIEDLKGPKTDVVDAYFLARLLWMELEMRAGRIVMSDLPEHQILTFNRATTTYPVNILARPFIQKANA